MSPLLALLLASTARAASPPAAPDPWQPGDPVPFARGDVMMVRVGEGEAACAYTGPTTVQAWQADGKGPELPALGFTCSGAFQGTVRTPHLDAVRPLVSPARAAEVLAALSTPAPLPAGDRTRQVYEARLLCKAGDPLALARGLTWLEQLGRGPGGGLRFAERQVYDALLDALVSELAAVTGQDPGSVEQEVLRRLRRPHAPAPAATGDAVDLATPEPGR